MSCESTIGSTSDEREREHERRNARQRELLEREYRRVEHRAQVEAQLRRYHADEKASAKQPRD